MLVSTEERARGRSLIVSDLRAFVIFPLFADTFYFVN